MDSSEVPAHLSIVLVTSPIGSHPDTAVIDQVIDSFGLVEGLEECGLVIVCDGVNLIEPDKTAKWKRGKVTSEQKANYKEYIGRLRDKYESTTAERTTKVIELDERHGFSHCLLHGLGHVDTRYTLVVQHDRAFVKSFSITNALALFLRPSIGHFLQYIGFQSKTCANQVVRSQRLHGDFIWPYKDGGKYYEETLSTEYLQTQLGLLHMTAMKADDQIAAEEKVPVTLPSCLQPLVFRYDSTHISPTESCRKLIKEEIKMGQFIEDTYSHRVMQEILDKFDPRRNDNPPYWTPITHLEQYGTFLYVDPDIGPLEPMVAHINGRKWISAEDRVKKGWPEERNLTQTKKWK